MIKSKYKKTILSKDIVSFDIFDTLIKRNCLNPDDIFDFVEKKYNRISKNKIKNFKKIRKDAYYIAKQKNNAEDATLDQIYECINPNYDVKLLQKLEIQTEFSFCVANLGVKPIYDFAKNNNKKIVCISDMYLDSHTLKKLLQKCGYYVDEVYVSCEYNKKKSTNKLFKELLNLKKFKKDEIVHFGDAEKGDFLYPKLLGISTFLIKSKKNNLFLNKKNIDLSKINNNIIFSITNNSNSSSVYYSFGYEVLGPVCLYFSLWLNKICTNKKNKLLFCARDMLIFQKIYGILFPNDINNAKYFYVSRRSLRIPFLYKCNSYDSIIDTLVNYRLSIKDILKNYNLINDDILQKIKDLGIDDNKIYEKKDLKNHDNDFYRLYFSILKDEIEKNGKNELENFESYLNSIHANNYYLIDMGWKGTTQKMLINIYPKKDIIGLYFGVENKSDYKEVNSKNSKGYLFYKNDEKIEDAELKIYSSQILFEKIFAAQHASTKRYDSKEPYYILNDDKILIDNNVNNMQLAAIDFVNDVKPYVDLFNDVDDYEYVNILIDNLISPNLQFANFFGEIINDNMYCRKMAAPKHLVYYFFHPFKLKSDIKNSEWKIGFMKRLFKVKLPYYNIYKIAYLSKKRGK